MKNILIVILILTMAQSLCAQDNWKLQTDRISSKWAKQVNPESVLKEYPRPQMVREDWMNLNGLWDFAVVDDNANNPLKYSRQILVPFAVESALSGLEERISEDEMLWYRRTFEVPKNWKSKDILLHFGAVDWETTVYVNGIEVGKTSRWIRPIFVRYYPCSETNSRTRNCGFRLGPNK